MGVYKNGKKLGQPYFNGKKMNCYHNGKKLWSDEYNEFIPESEGTFDLIYEGLDIDNAPTNVEADIVAYQVIGWENPRSIDYLKIPSEKNGKPVTQLNYMCEQNDGYRGSLINHESVHVKNFLIGSGMLRIGPEIFGASHRLNGEFNSFVGYKIDYFYLPSTVTDINDYKVRSNIISSGDEEQSIEMCRTKTIYFNCKNATANYSTSKGAGYEPWDFPTMYWVIDFPDNEFIIPEIIIGKDVEILNPHILASGGISGLSFDRKTKVTNLPNTMINGYIGELDIPKKITILSYSAINEALNNIDYGAKYGIGKATIHGDINLIGPDGNPTRAFTSIYGKYLTEANILGDHIYSEDGQRPISGPRMFFIRNLSDTSIATGLEYQEELFDLTTPFSNYIEKNDEYWILHTSDNRKSLIHYNHIKDSTEILSLEHINFTRLDDLGDLSFGLENVMEKIILPHTLEIIKRKAVFGGTSSRPFKTIQLGSAENESNVTYVESEGLFATSKYTLIIYSTTPPNIEEGSFGYLNINTWYNPLKILVPATAVDTYKNHPDWISTGYAELVEAIEEV